MDKKTIKEVLILAEQLRGYAERSKELIGGVENYLSLSFEEDKAFINEGYFKANRKKAIGALECIEKAIKISEDIKKSINE